MSRDAETVAVWRKAAEQGDAAAQYSLGEAFRLGLKAPRDAAQAVLWLNMAAAQGHPQAAFSLNQMKMQGIDVSPPAAAAPKRERQSLDELLDSLKPAQGREGDCGMDAPLIEPTLESDPLDLDAECDPEALKQAAQAGDAAAMVALGNAYRQGLGFEIDEVEAFTWYKRAADAGDVRGHFSLGVMYDLGMGVRASDNEALRHYLAAAKAGDAEAQFNLANMIRAGRGCPADAAVAAQWYRKAADQGDAAALFALGGLHESGADLDCAVDFYKKAAAKGSPEALFNLGNMARLGRGMAADDESAMDFYTQASELGLLQAQVNLGLMLLTDDPASAAYWLRRAALAGDALARLNLAGLYAAGKGVPKDEVEAHMWLDLVVQSATGDIAAAARSGAQALALVIGEAGLVESRLRRDRRNLGG